MPPATLVMRRLSAEGLELLQGMWPEGVFMDTAEEIQMPDGTATEIRRTQGFHGDTARVRIMRNQAAHRFRGAPGVVTDLVQMQVAFERQSIATGIELAGIEYEIGLLSPFGEFAAEFRRQIMAQACPARPVSE